MMIYFHWSVLLRKPRLSLCMTLFIDIYFHAQNQCFIPWYIPHSWQWGSVKNESLFFSIVNFQSICSNFRRTLAYVIYISQLIPYSWVCGFNRDFLDRLLLLSGKRLSQGSIVVMLRSPLRQFLGRHHDLVKHYGVSVSEMTTDVPFVVITIRPFLIHDLLIGLYQE